MAGGMILLGVLLSISTSRSDGGVLHHQFAANGWRACCGGACAVPIFYNMFFGALVAFWRARRRLCAGQADGLFSARLMPSWSDVLPRRAHPNIEMAGIAFLTGALTTVVQFMAGVGGRLPRYFSQKSTLDRKTHGRHQGRHADHQPCASRRLFRHVRRPRQSRLGRHAPARWPSPVAVTSVTPYVIDRMTTMGFANDAPPSSTRSARSISRVPAG